MREDVLTENSPVYDRARRGRVENMDDMSPGCEIPLESKVSNIEAMLKAVKG